jgi:transposase
LEGIIESNTPSLKQALELLIDLPNIQIEEACEDRNGHYILTVVSTEKGTHCHACGKRIDKANGHGEFIELRHLDLLGKQVHLRLRLPRYQCDCAGQPTTTQQLSWFTRRSGFTTAFEKRILLSCVNSTIADVAIKEHVSYELVKGVVDRNIDQSVDWERIRQLDVIGIDEIALKKGHQDFVAIVTGRSDDEIHVLGVLKDRSKQTVKQFFLSIPNRLRLSVRYVCSDMYDGFINAAKEVFGKSIRIVADRFHVAKLYRAGLENLRKQELRRLQRALAPMAYQQLKGAMWALRKQVADVTAAEQTMLDKLFAYSPRLQQAYVFRNQLTAIFDETLTRTQAKHLLNGWAARVRRSAVRCFDGFVKTLMARKDEISNYFLERHTSGFVEGLNNKIKVIKRRCYGILNPGHLFQRIYLDLCGYKLYA